MFLTHRYTHIGISYEYIYLLILKHIKLYVHGMCWEDYVPLIRYVVVKSTVEYTIQVRTYQGCSCLIVAECVFPFCAILLCDFGTIPEQMYMDINL